MKKIFRLLSVLLILMFLVSCATDTEEDIKTDDELLISYSGTVFRYGENEFDIAKRDKFVYSISEYKKVGSYILITGSIGKNAAYYGAFSTKTEEFEMDIEASKITYLKDRIHTIVYSFGSEIFNYEGNLIKKCDLAEFEYIYDIAYEDDGTQLKIEIASINLDSEIRTELLTL